MFSTLKKILPLALLLCVPAAHAQKRLNPNQLPLNTVLNSGNLSPLFNTNISNQSIAYTLLNAPANTVFGNCTASPTFPSFCSLTAAMEPSTTVNAITNDTNVIGSISGQNLTLGWAGALTVPRGGTGVQTLTGLLKGNGTSPFSAALYSDVTALWTGTCNSTTVLKGDGSCGTPILFQVNGVTAGSQTTVNFAAGSNVTITDNGSGTLTFAATGGSSGAFSSLTDGTNTQAAMVVGTGASLGVTGSGTISATSAPFSGLSGSTNTTAAMVVGTGASLNPTGSGVVNANQVSATTVPTNSSADQILDTSASATGLWVSVPLCTDSGGNHLNYNTATHAFSCGTSGGTAGSAAFNTITSGTNASAAMVVGTGSSLGVSGSGTIAATSAPFSGLSSSTNSTAAMVVGTGGSLDVSGSGTINANKVTGTTVPTNSAADQFLGTTASATGAWASVPSCLDSGGNHLNYNTSTHAFACGTSGGTAGSAAFNTITSGTNSSAAMTVGTGSSLNASGSGTITATAGTRMS